jgi:GTP cyclohydrolase II
MDEMFKLKVQARIRDLSNERDVFKEERSKQITGLQAALENINQKLQDALMEGNAMMMGFDKSITELESLIKEDLSNDSSSGN